MAEIRPFAAYRPAVSCVEKIAALPYDVYNRKEACEVVSKNPDSFLAIDRAETSFDDSVDTYAPEVYQKAKELLQNAIAQGKFIKENKPCYYLYEQVFLGKSQTGIVAAASIDDYLKGSIKKHENTRADKEIDRINHVDVCNMQTGPIFLLYKEDELLMNLINETKKKTPVYDFTSEDEIVHRVWVIDGEEDILTIAERFREIPSIYIADGHHRCASAVKVGLKRRKENPEYNGDEEFNYFLCVLFQAQELRIFDYNRVVKDLNGLEFSEFIKVLDKDFIVEKAAIRPYKPKAPHTFGMFVEDTWYKLTAREHILSDDPVKGLDVSILQDNLLSPILGIEDPKTDKRIDFVGGIRGLEELERRVNSDMKIAFSMYPTSVEELIDVADDGKLMPPKSTWFEPKLRSGLFLHELN